MVSQKRSILLKKSLK